MRACVVFAVSVFSGDRLYVLREFLDTFKLHYSDCDFYIGVNYGSIPEVEDVIDEYNLNTQVVRVIDKTLYCGSDASAYQAALLLLKNNNKQYDLYWFAHTKGAVNNRPAERLMYLTELFGNRVQVEGLFKTHSKLGSYALRGVSRGAAGHDWSVFDNDHYLSICTNQVYDVLKYTHVNWSYIETMYAIKGDVVEAFLHNAPDDFYTHKIQEPCYFEITFPWTVSRCGYFPYIRQAECFFGERNLKDMTSEWINQNNLQELNNYLFL